ncbi:MAG: Xaa-Pro peptidase family protein [Deltaproteobacteria bacterium]|nr:Xaa-Pro peptidase family protein [Deltaproteobacteria bacterium]
MKFERRINRLQAALRERDLAGAILFYSRDIYYYTGTSQPAYLVVLPDDYRLLIRRGYEIARRESGLAADRIQDGRKPQAMLARLFPGPGAGEKVGTELDMLTVPHAEGLSRALGGRQLVDLSAAVLQQRMVKDAGEIESITNACAAIQAGHLAAVSCLRAGLSELELAAAVENAQRLAGHEGCFFMRTTDFVMSRGPLASGPNLRHTSGTLFTLSGAGLSRAVSTGPSRRIIKRGDLVLVDIPACVEGYHADQSRTYAVGQAPARALDLFGSLREIADHLIGCLRPGLTAGEAFALAQARAVELDLGEAFMAFASGAKAHFVGHGIGLELNEPPLLARHGDTVLQEGMVLAIEMHLMEPNGLTLKLEDTVHLTAQRAEILTLSPRELPVVDLP